MNKNRSKIMEHRLERGGREGGREGEREREIERDVEISLLSITHLVRHDNRKLL